MRLPNGFGQITKIDNKRLRNPYRVMVTVGKDEYGKPICKILKPKGYFKTYNEAYEALVEYNRSPYQFASSMTLKEVYDEWLKEYNVSGVAESTKRVMCASWKYLKPLWDMPIGEVRPISMKKCIEDANVGNSSKKNMKLILNKVFDYAIENGIVETNYARNFTLPKNITRSIALNYRGHIPFTDEEMQKIKENVNIIPYCDILYYQCYSGWRPNELCGLKTANVNLNSNIIIGGGKTRAGTNRRVPIHPKVRNIIEKYYKEAIDEKRENLFGCPDRRLKDAPNIMTYTLYRKRFIDIKEKLGLATEHSPHDARVQFATMAKKYNVDEYAIKRIMGHEIKDITEKVYTKRDDEWLMTEIEKIK